MVAILMVRSASWCVSNHEGPWPSFETPRKSAAPQDEELPVQLASRTTVLR
jgi:hypothetical protein